MEDILYFRTLSDSGMSFFGHSPFTNLLKKVAVIIGGSKGIGFAVAKNLVQSGVSRMIIASRDVKTGVKNLKHLNEICGLDQKAVHVPMDITSSDQLKSSYTC